jgi:hypothetical protein
MKRLPCNVSVLKLSTLVGAAFVGGAGLLPTQASAQVGLPIPIPRFDLRPPYYSGPSHRSSSHAKPEENNGISTEKDATHAEPNASTSTEHQQQQVSEPTRDVGPPAAKSNPPQNSADSRLRADNDAFAGTAVRQASLARPIPSGRLSARRRHQIAP